MAGWSVEFAPVTSIVHKGGASTKQVYGAMQLQLLTSTLLYYQRHFSKIQLQQLRLSRLIIVMARLMYEAYRYGAAGTSEEGIKAWESLRVEYRSLKWWLAPLMPARQTVKSNMVEESRR